MSDSSEFVSFFRAPERLPRRPLIEFARLLRERVAAGQPFHCRITDDRELRRLNRRFLNLDYPTDVLSFPEASPEPAGGGSLGELAISASRAVAQAREHGHAPLEEIQILMLHGLLHLLGMDHQTDTGRMARTEKRWRKKLGLPAGLIERAKS
ncbi:MAG: rRNA maturation RNase YbeY [Bryobacteraceae bacterium]